MANLTESPVYEAGIFQLEKTTPPLGGAPAFNGSNPSSGHANVQALQLANRTSYLKQQVDNLVSVYFTDFTSLRSYTGNSSIVYVTDPDIGGAFYRNVGGVDDGAIQIGDYKRFIYGNYQASWWGVSTANSDNTSSLNSCADYITANGGGIVDIGYGLFNFGSSGIRSYGNVMINGKGIKATTLFITSSPTTIGIDLIKVSGTYNLGGISNLTVNNTGSIGLYGLRTPEDEDGFNNSQKYRIENVSMRGFGWTRYYSMGDCSQVEFSFPELRGPYIPSNTDAGQVDLIGIYMSGVRGVVRLAVENFAIIGVRRGIVIGEFVEGIWLDKGEITNCWEGLISTTVTSKPGGFADNLHISANKRCIGLQARRDFQIGKVQCYRSTGMFAHGTGWKGFELLSSQRMLVDSVEIRNTVTDTGEQIGISLSSPSKVTFTKVMVAEDGYLTHLVDVSGTTSLLRFSDVVFGTVATGLRLAGTVVNSTFGLWTCDSLPATPFTFPTTGIDKPTVKLPTFSCVEDYTESTYTTSTTLNLTPNLAASRQKASVTSAVAVDYVLNNPLAMKGARFEIRLTITQVTATFRVLSSTGSVLVTITGNTGANTLRNIFLVHNGAGWVVDSVLTTSQ